MSRIAVVLAGVTALIAAGILLSCIFIVYQTQQALVVQFGVPLRVVAEPGLHAKLPWQSVLIFDRRLLNLDAPSEEVIAQDKKRIVVDAFARWRIVDPQQFSQTLTDEENAGSRLDNIMSSEIRRVLGSQDFATMLSPRRADLMREIRDDMNQDTQGFGIRIVDVRIRHADLPPDNSQAIYQRMTKEREREAAEYRAEGDETAQRIRARADREVTVIKAEAMREAQILQGEGEAEKTKTLAEAYGQDPDFFSFYRSMQAYRDALGGNNTTVVLSPNNDFFRYFGGGAGGPAKK